MTWMSKPRRIKKVQYRETSDTENNKYECKISTSSLVGTQNRKSMRRVANGGSENSFSKVNVYLINMWWPPKACVLYSNCFLWVKRSKNYSWFISCRYERLSNFIKIMLGLQSVDVRSYMYSEPPALLLNGKVNATEQIVDNFMSSNMSRWHH